MTKEGRKRVEGDEKQPEKKDEPKEGYRKPELTKFGPVEEFTGDTPS